MLYTHFIKIILLGIKTSNKIVSWNRETLSRGSNMWMSLFMHVSNNGLLSSKMYSASAWAKAIS